MNFTDITVEEAVKEVRRQRGDEANALLKKRVQWIKWVLSFSIFILSLTNVRSVLKPWRAQWTIGPSRCTTPPSWNKNLNLEVADLLYLDFVIENASIYYRSKHKWYYLSGHEVSEVVIFKQSDSLPNACSGKSFWWDMATRSSTHAEKNTQGVSHCSFDNPLTPAGEELRESIKTRALLYYDE